MPPPLSSSPIYLLRHRPSFDRILLDLSTALANLTSPPQPRFARQVVPLFGMNWTEGNLARHSRGKSAKDDVLKRQKQYFARARTRLLNGVANPNPAIFPFPETRHDQPSGHGNPFSRGDRPRAAKRRRDDDTIYHSRNKSTGTPMRNQDVLLHSNAKTPAQAQAPTEGFQEEIDSLRKRRKLLGKTDWAGLSMQQPLELTFPGIRQPGQRWGKPDGPRMPYQARVRHAHAADQSDPDITISRKYQGPSSPRIRVHIGSQRMSHGTDSVSRRSKERGYSSSKSSSSRGSRVDSVRRLEQLSPSSAEGCQVHSELGAGRVHPVPSISRESLSCDDHRKPSKWYGPAHPERLQPKLHEPVPLRAGHFPVLHWSPPRAKGPQSMLVETGRESTKPPSQLADERKWFKLTESPNEELIPLTRGSSLLGSPSFCLTNSMHECGGRYCSSSFVSHGSQWSPASPTRDGPMDLSDPNGLVESVESKARAGTSPGPHGVVHSQPRHLIATESPNTSPKGQAPLGETDEDDDQVWKNFISEHEGDEPQRRAFIEAAQSAARCFGPSDSSTTSSSRLCSELLQMMTERMEARLSAFDSSPESLGVSGSSDSPNNGDDVPVDLSNMASYSSEPSELASLTEPHVTSILPHSGMGASPVPSDGSTLPKDPESPSMVVSSDPDSTMAVKASSSEDQETKEIRRPFQFAIPRSFVGKRAEKDKVASVQPPQSKPGRGRGRGRRRRKAEDGRINIRSLPDVDDDPIEDTDGD